MSTKEVSDIVFAVAVVLIVMVGFLIKHCIERRKNNHALDTLNKHGSAADVVAYLVAMGVLYIAPAEHYATMGTLKIWLSLNCSNNRLAAAVVTWLWLVHEKQPKQYPNCVRSVAMAIREKYGEKWYDRFLQYTTQRHLDVSYDLYQEIISKRSMSQPPSLISTTVLEFQ